MSRLGLLKNRPKLLLNSFSASFDCLFKLFKNSFNEKKAKNKNQGIGIVKSVEQGSSKGVAAIERKLARPQKEEAVNCPRCNSTNTKFCYYNNYSLSQPRYFCKTCRRYWTEGGSLRNVPVGGGSRKNKRSNSSYNSNNNNSSTISSSSSKKIQDLTMTTPKLNEPHLNFSNISEFMALPFNNNLENNKSLSLMNPINSTTSFMSSLPISDNTLYSSSTTVGIHNLHDLKPMTLNFSLDHHHHHGFENGYGGGQDDHESSAKLFFPLDDLKTSNVSTNDHHHHHQADHQSNGFWNGMLGGGSSW